MSENWYDRISANDTAFFLDVDGTLLGFKPQPMDVVADDALRVLLRDLHAKACGAVALVSGRTIEDLDRIMAPLVLPAAGTHGAELRFGNGDRVTGEVALLDDLRATIERFVAGHPGLVLEDKGSTLAIHYRHAPNLQADVAHFLDYTVVRDDLMVQHGKMVAEVKSASSDKGSAIATMMRLPPFVGRKPLFIGDDLTDEHGFKAVNKLGGISIRVTEGATEAQYRLAGVTEVRHFLARILSGSCHDKKRYRVEPSCF